MKRWEYKWIWLERNKETPDAIDKQLSAFGDEGWELVTAEKFDLGIYKFWLKREKENSQ